MAILEHVIDVGVDVLSSELADVQCDAFGTGEAREIIERLPVVEHRLGCPVAPLDPCQVVLHEPVIGLFTQLDDWRPGGLGRFTRWYGHADPSLPSTWLCS